MKRSCNPTGLTVGTQTVRIDGDCSLSSDSGAGNDFEKQTNRSIWRSRLQDVFDLLVQ